MHDKAVSAACTAISAMKAACEAALRDKREGAQKHPIRQSDAKGPLVAVSAVELLKLLATVARMR